MKTSYSGQRVTMLMLVSLTAACSSSGAATPSPNSVGGANGQGGINSSQGGATSSIPGAGGAPTGGAGASVGGSSASIGGGAAATGGTTQSNGGAATGGKAAGTGGAAAGGKSSTTGGVATGGKASSGGGAATGGKATVTGGASNGGGSTGGASNATPSSGCSLTSVTTGKTIDNTMTVAGQSTTREYRLSVPTDYVPGEPLPVVFVFNGVGGTGPQAQTGFNVETGHRAIFVYPTALPNSQANGSIAWDFSSTGVDVPFFDAMLAYVEQNYCVDTSRIFALGASSGGIFSNMLGCFRGDVLRAIAPSSGMTWQQGGCKGDVAVMIICGAQDTYNPCDDAKNGAASETAVWVPQNSCGTTSAASPLSDICVAYQNCKPADPVLLCTQPGGHGWLPAAYSDIWWQFFMGLS